jgi:hypothetical protein
MLIDPTWSKPAESSSHRRRGLDHKVARLDRDGSPLQLSIRVPVLFADARGLFGQDTVLLAGALLESRIV